MEDLSVLSVKIKQWGKDRGINQNGTLEGQVLKAVSEMGELADAVAKGDGIEIVDAIGDIFVCLVMAAEIHGKSIEKCVTAAWDQIKDRKGKLMPNGVFVKE